MDWDDKIKIELSMNDKKILEDHIYIFLDNEIINKLNHAEVAGSNLVVTLTVEELDYLLGFIAAEANHSKDKNIEAALDDLYDGLEKYIDV